MVHLMVAADLLLQSDCLVTPCSADSVCFAISFRPVSKCPATIRTDPVLGYLTANRCSNGLSSGIGYRVGFDSHRWKTNGSTTTDSTFGILPSASCNVRGRVHRLGRGRDRRVYPDRMTAAMMAAAMIGLRAGLEEMALGVVSAELGSSNCGGWIAFDQTSRNAQAECRAMKFPAGPAADDEFPLPAFGIPQSCAESRPDPEDSSPKVVSTMVVRRGLRTGRYALRRERRAGSQGAVAAYRRDAVGSLEEHCHRDDSDLARVDLVRVGWVVAVAARMDWAACYLDQGFGSVGTAALTADEVACLSAEPLSVFPGLPSTAC